MDKPIFNIINKKFIISVVTSSTFITGFTIAVIWFYLSNIDRLDIFFRCCKPQFNLRDYILFYFIIDIRIQPNNFHLIFYFNTYLLWI